MDIMRGRENLHVQRGQVGRLPEAQIGRHAEPDLKFPIGPDCVVVIDFKGPVSQRAIDKLIKQLELVKDNYPVTTPTLTAGDGE